MYSLEVIKEMNQEAMNQAIDNNKVPVNVFSNGIVNPQKVKNIPSIGDFRPKNFELVNEYFVDSSGFGAVGEMALTFNQFLEVVKEGYFYAIIETGQFQVYIGEFKKVE